MQQQFISSISRDNLGRIYGLKNYELRIFNMSKIKYEANSIEIPNLEPVCRLFYAIYVHLLLSQY